MFDTCQFAALFEQVIQFAIDGLTILCSILFTSDIKDNSRQSLWIKKFVNKV
jgi:hypothetical protein